MEKEKRKEMQVREKVGFKCFVAVEGRKGSSLKRRVRSQLAK